MIKELLVFAGAIFLLAVILNLRMRSFWLATGLTTFAGGVANLVYETGGKPISLRPVDVLYWAPVLLFWGMLAAFPVACVAGFSLRRFRKWAQR